MQEHNNKLNSLLQNVASSILTNDNGVINVDNKTDDAIVVDSDDASVVIVEGNEGDVRISFLLYIHRVLLIISLVISHLLLYK